MSCETSASSFPSARNRKASSRGRNTAGLKNRLRYSEPGSTVYNSGSIRFEPAGADATRVTIHMTYLPPGGALGHFAAKLFGADPKAALDDDLVRLKSLLEAGRASAPGKRATREELVGASALNGPGGQGI